MKTAIVLLSITLIISIGLTVWYRSQVEDLGKELRLAAVKQQSDAEKIGELYRKVEKYSAELEKSQARRLFVISDETTSENLMVYGCDIDTYQKTTEFYISVPDSLPTLDKLQILAKYLSGYFFGRNKIDVLRIEDRDEGRIAVVQLAEYKYSTRPWKGGYFEGSTGGRRTSTTLIETLLQRQYTGEWIDGVEFSYEGDMPLREFDHVKPLYYTVFRDTSKKSP